MTIHLVRRPLMDWACTCQGHMVSDLVYDECMAGSMDALRLRSDMPGPNGTSTEVYLSAAKRSSKPARKPVVF